ncbi:MAG: restriction endonuclease subunit S [Methanoculleus sp.]|uniref:restriction endonuclease subunit S n=2 Tax=Methanoculleus TaxID=45989 RepID=UPI0025FEA1FE|nr:MULTISPECIES: restriction endonuclease subunit S [unclassified Methanoculleus]MDD2255205.1 restriction endonuclease subunit S [Methanoculleus sp.]MDD4314164.1 restriction endonuclease subunit S [Methanoculleus sp.]MDD4472121.1 restriction endonuclease subunit S [Methanoculleus sp.]HOI57809.1 restriction endonuclease subunit S [Methanoculleus sp.]
MSTAPRRRPGWQSAILQDLVFFQRGYDITKAEQKPGNIPVVSSSGVNSYHSEAKVDGPGVVIGRKGSLGTVHYVDGPYWPHDTTLWSRDFKGNLPRFVFYFLQTLGLERYDVGNSNPTLNRNHIHRLDILLPEYQIQERIVEVLSAYDDLIENNRRRIQLLEEAARLLYREWFVNLRFPGHEHVAIKDGVPEGWEKKTLVEIAATNVESYKASALPDIINYIDISSVKQGRIINKNTMPSSEAPGRARRKARPGDIIWSNVRPNLRAFALIPDPEENDVFSTGFTVISPITVPFTYLYLFVTTDEFVGHLVNHTTGASYPAVRPEDFERAIVLVPPKQMLELFNEKAEPIYKFISVLEEEMKLLAQARDLLLPRLMNGEIAV